MAAKNSRVIARERIKPGIWKRIGADGKPVYEITFRDAEGRQRRRTVAGGSRAADNALSTELARRSRGEKIAADPRLRFNEAADAWWQARVVKLRPATQSAYGAGLKHLGERYGNRRMSDITPTDVAAYVSAMQAQGFKGWTLKGHLTVLSSIFTYSARHLGLVGVNPVSLLDRVERPSSDDEKSKRILTGDELRRLLESIDAQHAVLFALGAETGARLAEVLGVVWENVDLDEQTIAFTHQISSTARGSACRSRPSAVAGRWKSRRP